MKTGLMAVALVGMLGSSGAVIAAASKHDGNELLRQCQQFIKAADSEKNFDPVDASYCGGFVQAVDSTVFFLSSELKNNVKFCTPDGVTNDQLVRVVVKFLKDNPKILNEDKAGLVWLALKDAYPCK